MFEASKLLRATVIAVGSVALALPASAQYQEQLQPQGVPVPQGEVSESVPTQAPDSRASLNAPDQEELLPPNARPGECYARAFVPPKYEPSEEKVLKTEASENLEIIPPQVEWVEQKVTIKEPSYKLEIVPAVYETVEEQVMVKPESKKIEVIPAKFETVEIEVLDQPAHTVWKTGRGPVEKVDNATGEIMCLVEVPATYKVVQEKKLVAPATTKETVIPAEFEIIKKQGMKTPPTTREVEIPAEFKTVKVQKIVKGPEIARTPVKEEFQTIAKTVKVKDGRMEWRSVLCETNVNPNSIGEIQAALRKAGFDSGTVRGKMTPKTIDALRAFQKSKGLAVGGLTLETLEALGVKRGKAPVERT